VLGATTLVSIDTIQFMAGHDYVIETADGTIAAGQTLTVDSTALGAADAMDFNASTETNGFVNFAGGAAGDVLELGNVAVAEGSAFDGGTGDDILKLDGDFSAGATLGDKIRNLGQLEFDGSFNYVVTATDHLVAAGHLLQIFPGVSAGHSITFDGSAETDGNFFMRAGAGANVLTGGALGDTFEFSQAGSAATAIVDGGGGGDSINFSSNFKASDVIDGGSGDDLLDLNGNYSGVTFGVTSIEEINFDGTHSYTLTLADGSVASGATMTLDSQSMGSTRFLNFDGSAQSNGSFIFYAGAGNDVLKGAGGADTFDLTTGGNDTVNAGGGDDSITMGATLTSGDRIDGGSGNDTLYVGGGNTTITLSSTTLVGVETIHFGQDWSYSFTSNDATVAAGATLLVDGTDLLSTSVAFNGAAETDGHFQFIGGGGNDVLTGGALADTFDLTGGGSDTATGNGGDDVFTLAGVLDAGDRINGGAGNDTVIISADYTVTPLVMSSATIINVETLQLTAGSSYNITTSDGNVAAGQTLKVDASALTTLDGFTFNGGGENNGSFQVLTGAGDDTLTGGSQADTFDMTQGGHDIVHGGGGADTIDYGATFGDLDTVDGGTGSDVLELDGDYSAAMSLFQVSSVERIALGAGHDYDFATDPANAASGQTMTIDASALGAADHLTIDASSYNANATLVIESGAGADTFTAGVGQDIYDYEGLALSGATRDTITNIDFTSGDKIQFHAVTGIDTAVTTGALNQASFDADLAAAIGSGQLAAGHAVEFTADSGDESGHTFLIIDGNGAAGYQAGSDLVIELVTPANAPTTANFIT